MKLESFKQKIGIDNAGTAFMIFGNFSGLVGQVRGCSDDNLADYSISMFNDRKWIMKQNLTQKELLQRAGKQVNQDNRLMNKIGILLEGPLGFSPRYKSNVNRELFCSVFFPWSGIVWNLFADSSFNTSSILSAVGLY